MDRSCCTGRDLFWAGGAILGGFCCGQLLLYWEGPVVGWMYCTGRDLLWTVGAVLGGTFFRPGDALLELICFRYVLCWEEYGF